MNNFPEELKDQIPEDQRDVVYKVYSTLEKTKKAKKAGLNVTNLMKESNLTYTMVNKALSVLSTLKIIQMEKIGSSKVYSLRGV